MPFVDISMGGGAFTNEQKTELSKSVYNAVIEFYQKTKGVKPHCWVVIREEQPESWVLDGEILSEIRKRTQAKK